MLQAIAPCKINLYLKVIRLRNDGYHEIDTVFMPLQKPYDEIIWSLNPAFDRELKLTVNNAEDVADDDSNLVYQAAMAYAEKAKISPSWTIELTKNIPVAAGLGGGSADAAAILLLLEEEFGFLSRDEIWLIAKELGADVPFFIESAPARARGIGNVITPIKGVGVTPPILLAAPEFPISSKWAYTHIPPEKICEVEDDYVKALIEALQDADYDYVGKMLYNDLEFAILDKFPLTRIIKQRLLETGASGAIVSGSGPSLFGVYPNFEMRDKAASILVKEMPHVSFYKP